MALRSRGDAFVAGNPISCTFQRDRVKLSLPHDDFAAGARRVSELINELQMMLCATPALRSGVNQE